MMRHFKTIPVIEKEALTYFIYMVKTNKSKLDMDRRDGLETD
jgi:histone deacetylase complex subunit SAP30